MDEVVLKLFRRSCDSTLAEAMEEKEMLASFFGDAENGARVLGTISEEEWEAMAEKDEEE